MSNHELFSVLLKGNSHEVMWLVDHVVFLHPNGGSIPKLESLLEFYKELKNS